MVAAHLIAPERPNSTTQCIGHSCNRATLALNRTVRSAGVWRRSRISAPLRSSRIPRAERFVAVTELTLVDCPLAQLRYVRRLLPKHAAGDRYRDAHSAPWSRLG